MQDMPLVSVIIPVYKSIYLRRCIDSVLSQTYKNFELILIDDESPDGGGEICDEYAEADQRVKVIHQKNGGISAARNKGLDICQGPFLTFIDDDDYIHRNTLFECIKMIVQEDSDIIFFHAQVVYSGMIKRPNMEIVDKEDIRPLGLCGRIPTPWGKIYKSKIWKNIRFPDGRLSEDCYLAVEIWHAAQKISVMPKIYYYYECAKHNSVSQKWNSKQDYDQFCAWRHCFEVARGLMDDDKKYAQVYFYRCISVGICGIMRCHIDHELAKDECMDMEEFICQSVKDERMRSITGAYYYSYKSLEEQMYMLHYNNPIWNTRFLRQLFHLLELNAATLVLNDIQLKGVRNSIKEVRKYNIHANIGNSYVVKSIEYKIPFLMRVRGNKILKRGIPELI